MEIEPAYSSYHAEPRATSPVTRWGCARDRGAAAPAAALDLWPTTLLFNRAAAADAALEVMENYFEEWPQPSCRPRGTIAHVWKRRQVGQSLIGVVTAPLFLTPNRETECQVEKEGVPISRAKHKLLVAMEAATKDHLTWADPGTSGVFSVDYDDDTRPASPTKQVAPEDLGAFRARKCLRENLTVDTRLQSKETREERGRRKRIDKPMWHHPQAFQL